MSNNVFLIPKNHEYIRKLKQYLEEAGVTAVVLKPFHYSSFMNLAKILFFRIKGYRIAHVHWLYIFPFAFVMKGFTYFCKSLRIKIVWEMHNILPHGHTEKDRKNSKWFYEKSDAIIFHSQHDIQRAKETFGTALDKTHIVIPHGNFNESYENTVTKSAARKKLDIPQGKRVVLCFGFIRENRGYEYLIEAVKDMRDTIVIIAGKLQDKQVYQMLLERGKEVPHLRLFVKWIDDKEIQVYFNACDIVVLPYTDITTSGVIPLAYAFSKPVVTTNIGGMQDIVTADTGLLVQPRDAKALRNAIENMFTKNFESMGEKAREYAKKEFSWESNTQKIKGLYDFLYAKEPDVETPGVSGGKS